MQRSDTYHEIKNRLDKKHYPYRKAHHAFCLDKKIRENAVLYKVPVRAHRSGIVKHIHSYPRFADK